MAENMQQQAAHKVYSPEGELVKDVCCICSELTSLEEEEAELVRMECRHCGQALLHEPCMKKFMKGTLHNTQLLKGPGYICRDFQCPQSGCPGKVKKFAYLKGVRKNSKKKEARIAGALIAAQVAQQSRRAGAAAKQQQQQQQQQQKQKAAAAAAQKTSAASTSSAKPAASQPAGASKGADGQPKGTKGGQKALTDPQAKSLQAMREAKAQARLAMGMAPLEVAAAKNNVSAPKLDASVPASNGINILRSSFHTEPHGGGGIPGAEFVQPPEKKTKTQKKKDALAQPKQQQQQRKQEQQQKHGEPPFGEPPPPFDLPALSPSQESGWIKDPSKYKQLLRSMGVEVEEEEPEPEEEDEVSLSEALANSGSQLDEATLLALSQQLCVQQQFEEQHAGWQQSERQQEREWDAGEWEQEGPGQPAAWGSGQLPDMHEEALRQAWLEEGGVDVNGVLWFNDGELWITAHPDGELKVMEGPPSLEIFAPDSCVPSPPHANNTTAEGLDEEGWQVLPGDKDPASAPLSHHHHQQQQQPLPPQHLPAQPVPVAWEQEPLQQHHHHQQQHLHQHHQEQQEFKAPIPSLAPPPSGPMPTISATAVHSTAVPSFPATSPAAHTPTPATLAPPPSGPMPTVSAAAVHSTAVPSFPTTSPAVAPSFPATSAATHASFSATLAPTQTLPSQPLPWAAQPEPTPLSVAHAHIPFHAPYFTAQQTQQTGQGGGGPAPSAASDAQAAPKSPVLPAAFMLQQQYQQQQHQHQQQQQQQEVGKPQAGKQLEPLDEVEDLMGLLCV